RVRLARVPGQRAEVAQLRVHVVERFGGIRLVHRNLEGGELFLDLRRIVRDDHQVRVFRRDGLGVRLVAGQVGLRRVTRVVGLVVEGPHVAARADREQHLGRGRRQRHDVRRALGGRHPTSGDGEGGGRGRGAGGGTARSGGAVTAGQGQADGG